MKRMRWFLVAVLATTLTLGGCGKEAGPVAATGPAGLRTATVPNDLGMLVPQDAMALVYMGNATEFETKLKTLLGKIEPGMAQEINLEAMGAQLLPGASQYWDRSKPCAIAISLGTDGDPMAALGSGQGVSFVFPMTDIDGAKEGMTAALAQAPEDQRPKFKSSGSYLAFSPSPDTAWGDSVPAIARQAPAGDVALRINLAGLVERFRPQIDDALSDMERQMGSGLEAMPDQDGANALGEMLGDLVGWAKDFVNSAELLEFGVAIEGDSADILVGFTAKAGSKLDVDHPDHGDLAALAAHLPAGFPMHFLVRWDLQKLVEGFKPFMEKAMESAAPGNDKEMGAIVMEALGLAEVLGPNLAMAGGVTEGGIQLVYLADVKDAKVFKQRYAKVMSLYEGMDGITFKVAGTTKVSGIDVTTYDLQMDMKALMQMQDKDLVPPPEAEQIFKTVMKRLTGGETIRFRMATVDNVLIYSHGDEAHVTSIIESMRGGKGKMPPALARAIEKAGGKPAFLLQMELRELMRQIMDAAEDVAEASGENPGIPAVPAGDAIPVMVWGAHEGRYYSGGLSVDIGGIVKLVEAMDR